MRHTENILRATCYVVVALALVLLASVSATGQRVRSSSGVYEGEDIVSSGKMTASGGKVSVQPMTGYGQGWSGGAQLFWGGGQPGAVLDLVLDIPAEGIYEVELYMTRAPDFGRLRIQVENKNVGERFDGYASTVTPSGAISLGTFALRQGPAKLSFMIDGKNPQSSNYFAGIDFIRLTRVGVSGPLSKTLTTGGSDPYWKADATIVTETTDIASDGNPAFQEGQALTVKCSYVAVDPNQWGARVIIFDVKQMMSDLTPDVTKDNVFVTESGERTKSYTVHSSAGQSEQRQAGCGVWVRIDPSKPWKLSMSAFKPYWVVEGKLPKPAKWPTAPVIVTPVQGGKIVVKPLNAFSSHCTDGSIFLFDWQYTEETWGASWQKMMVKPLACVPDGSVKDISGLKPGLYRVRVQEINGKYKFTSDWSEWVYFKAPGTK